MRVSRNKVDFVTLSSSGFPSINELPGGSTLHFIDTGEQYVAYNGTWEQDMRVTSVLETEL